MTQVPEHNEEVTITVRRFNAAATGPQQSAGRDFSHEIQPLTVSLDTERYSVGYGCLPSPTALQPREMRPVQTRIWSLWSLL